MTALQWTGVASRQAVTAPWTRITDFDALEAFAKLAEAAERRRCNCSTALGEALQFAHARFAAAPSCKRRVIDIPGGGSSNEGARAPKAVRGAWLADGMGANALVIKGVEPEVTECFWENVVPGSGLL